MKNKYVALALSIALFAIVVAIDNKNILSLFNSAFNTATVINSTETFYRGINLNGPSVTIDGNSWAGKENASNYTYNDSLSFYEKGVMIPATDADRQTMLRSGLYNFAGSNVTLTNVESGKYKVYMYIWEDTGDTVSDFYVNGTKVQGGVHSGSAGNWTKLGPWSTDVSGGQIKVNAVTANGDAVILSGIEVWRVWPAQVTYTPSSPSGVFYRAIDLDGDGGSIDGHIWEGRGASNVSTSGNTSQPNNTPIDKLTPVTDDVRANMIHNGVYRLTDSNGGTKVTLTSVPSAIYDVYLYVFEDNVAQSSSVYVNGVQVTTLTSGPAGDWRRLGPFPVTVKNGSIEIKSTTSNGDALIFSGFEVWKTGDVAVVTTPIITQPVATTTSPVITAPVATTTSPVITPPIATTTPIVSTGDIRVKRIGADDAVTSAPADTTVHIDSGSTLSGNPATSANQVIGNHTLYIKDIANTTKTINSCEYARGGAECWVSGVTAPLTSCSGGVCSIPVVVKKDIVTKVVIKYVPSTTTVTGSSTPPAEVVPIPIPVAPTGTNYPVKTSQPDAFMGMEIKFDYAKGTDGRLLAGPGYEISQYTDNTSKQASLYVFFDQGHYGVFTMRPVIAVPILDTNSHSYRIRHDLQRVGIYRDGSPIQGIVSDCVFNGLGQCTGVYENLAINFGSLWMNNSTTDLVINPYIGVGTPFVSSKVSNASVLPFDGFKPAIQYVWDGSVGNTSIPQTGINAWAGYHSIMQIVFWKDATTGTEYGIANMGYNENHYELALFDAANPHKILKVFGLIHDIFDGEPGGGGNLHTVISKMSVSGDTLTITRYNGRVDTYSIKNLVACLPGCKKGPRWDRNTFIVAGNPYISPAQDSAIDGNAYKVGTQTIGSLSEGYKDPKVFPETLGTPRFAPIPTSYFGPHPMSIGRQSDGKVWLSDPATNRVLRFSPNSSGTLVYDGTMIAYGPISYTTTVDKGNPTRVFNRYLEYQVDYRYPLDNSVAGHPGWKLVRNWETNNMDRAFNGFGDGLKAVLTIGSTNASPLFTSGKTYGIVLGGSGGLCQIVELNPNVGLIKIASAGALPCTSQFEIDGSIVLRKSDGYYKRTFATSGPVDTYLRNIPANDITDPGNAGQSYIRTLAGKLAVWRQTILSVPKHLAVFANSGTSDAVLAAPKGDLDGNGNVSAHTTSLAGPMDTVGSNIFAVFRGEFWKEPWRPAGQGIGQADQIYHYQVENGALVFKGQFGIPNIVGEESDYNAPGVAGNVHSIDAVEVNGETFIYTNAEAGTGVQRWRVVR